MRIGSNILFLNGYCYQSYEWKLMRPLGNIQNIIDHLDSYKVDEISIIRPIREHENTHQLINDIKILEKINSSTPISFGGGIRKIKHLELIKNLPFERYIFSSSLFNDSCDLIKEAVKIFGKQAVIGLIPFKYEEELMLFNSSLNNFLPVSSLNLKNLNLCDEIILLDCFNEGNVDGFETKIFKDLNLDINNCIVSGGVSNFNFKKNLINNSLKSVIVENKVLHKESSILNYYAKL